MALPQAARAAPSGAGLPAAAPQAPQPELPHGAAAGSAGCAIGCWLEAHKAKSAELRSMRIDLRTTQSLSDLAGWLNPIVAGWMHYYGRFYRSAVYPLLQRVNAYLRRWAGRKYKRLRSFKRFQAWWNGLLQRQPRLFTHWKWSPWLPTR